MRVAYCVLRIAYCVKGSSHRPHTRICVTTLAQQYNECKSTSATAEIRLRLTSIRTTCTDEVVCQEGNLQMHDCCTVLPAHVRTLVMPPLNREERRERGLGVWGKGGSSRPVPPGNLAFFGGVGAFLSRKKGPHRPPCSLLHPPNLVPRPLRRMPTCPAGQAPACRHPFASDRRRGRLPRPTALGGCHRRL